MKILKTIGKYFLVSVVTFITIVFVLMAMAIQGHAEDKTYWQVLASASDSDLRAMENVIYHESAVADCPFETNVAVAQTILNRYMSGKWGDSIESVCKAKGQFCYRKMPSKMNEHTAEDISDAIEYLFHGGEGFIPYDYVFFATKKQSYARDHIWIGETKNGKPRKGKGMYFGR